MHWFHVVSVERSNTAYNSLHIVCIGFMSWVSKAGIVACSLCSYVCIGLPGPAHPPKVKYSLKAIFVVSVERCYCGLLSLLVCVYWPARTSTPSQSEIFSQAVIVACSLCSYVCIGLPGPAHPPKVKYSLKAIFVVSVEISNTAYNSLHIDCIGFMLWVSKDQTQHTIVYT